MRPEHRVVVGTDVHADSLPEAGVAAGSGDDGGADSHDEPPPVMHRVRHEAGKEVRPAKGEPGDDGGPEHAGGNSERAGGALTAAGGEEPDGER
jgi:hypothetical protein